MVSGSGDRGFYSGVRGFDSGVACSIREIEGSIQASEGSIQVTEGSIQASRIRFKRRRVRFDRYASISVGNADLTRLGRVSVALLRQKSRFTVLGGIHHPHARFLQLRRVLLPNMLVRVHVRVHVHALMCFQDKKCSNKRRLASLERLTLSKTRTFVINLT
ncbi:hypothetical protein Acr_00g0085570 [Actinidia rufa]|uniref:Uncharacterized protein n=1 Tax=Actinidia rufa TaxID=165716 RepID=A0A7J0DW60_9ERIC|nr:hypothetical protein Acr_00g0085570 [Actinidia rufa]